MCFVFCRLYPSPYSPFSFLACKKVDRWQERQALYPAHVVSLVVTSTAGRASSLPRPCRLSGNKHGRQGQLSTQTMQSLWWQARQVGPAFYPARAVSLVTGTTGRASFLPKTISSLWWQARQAGTSFYPTHAFYWAMTLPVGEYTVLIGFWLYR
jgi:hypothetical protein